MGPAGRRIGLLATFFLLLLPVISKQQVQGLLQTIDKQFRPFPTTSSSRNFDPNSNHIGLDINSIQSNQTVSPLNFEFQLVLYGTRFFHFWVHYDGFSKYLEVYMVDEDHSTPTKPRPSKPAMTADLDTSRVLKQYSHLGLSASTGTNVQLNSVLLWNLKVDRI
ncbi:hypothetical protein CRG98_029202 [Punica granatum]|uniref:Legume lectin domain-containing protein n=1 Tax=Punica granatum TaxID=22663 RepID=A0A2I0J2J2_PUNGR|nr:hypothetical protein CRG98_029202 [Punica granatum]